MSLTPGQFRDVLGRLGGGVTVVTTRDDAGEARGLTATAVCAVSLEPPLLLACIGLGSATGAAIRSSGRYAVNVLAADGRHLSDRFAASGEGKFDGIEWADGQHGLPLLAGCLACVECQVEQAIDSGDHTIFIGRVLSGSVGEPGADPLLHFRGEYRLLGDDRGS